MSFANTRGGQKLLWYSLSPCLVCSFCALEFMSPMPERLPTCSPSISVAQRYCPLVDCKLMHRQLSCHGHSSAGMHADAHVVSLLAPHMEPNM